MWLISGDTKDTVIYCYITVISELIKIISICFNKLVNNSIEYDDSREY